MPDTLTVDSDIVVLQDMSSVEDTGLKADHNYIVVLAISCHAQIRLRRTFYNLEYATSECDLLSLPVVRITSDFFERGCLVVLWIEILDESVLSIRQ